MLSPVSLGTSPMGGPQSLFVFLKCILCLEGFYLSPAGRKPRGGLRRMLTSCPGGVLMHQTENIEGVRSFSGQFHLQRMSPKRDQTEVSLPQHCLEHVTYLLLNVLG